MRRLEKFEYDCPVCAAPLVVHGTDFCYQVDKGEETKTTYKCGGCGEMWSYIEKAYISPEDVAPQFNCMFCKQKCHYLSLKDDWSDYWKCLPCKVSYEQRINNHEWNGINTINMYTMIKDNLYVLRQHLDLVKSSIVMLPEDIDDTIVTASEFLFLMPNITPSNIQSKLLTYLVFC